jgi:hypothetical protein
VLQLPKDISFTSSPMRLLACYPALSFVQINKFAHQLLLGFDVDGQMNNRFSTLTEA